MDFKGKKILVTGATGGIGGDIVGKFLSLNGTVLGTGTNLEKLNSLKDKNPNLITEQFDISKHDKIDEFIERVFSNLGGLDILINNAGITKDNLSLRMKNEEWQKVKCDNTDLKIEKVIENLSEHPFVISNLENAKKIAKFRIFSLKKFL